MPLMQSNMFETGTRFFAAAIVAVTIVAATIGNMYNTILHAAGVGREHFGQLDVNMPEKDQKGPLSELLA